MVDAVRLSLTDAESLARRALQNAGASAQNAACTAVALLRAEADGQHGHGLSRIPSYAAQARVGKVRGHARPTLREIGAAQAHVDAAQGFAYPAIELALNWLLERAPHSGIAMAAIGNSHHFGQAGAHVERLAEAGLVGMMFGNAPKAMAFWGGREPMLGTNPIAFAAPLAGERAGESSGGQAEKLSHEPPLVIDLALSVAARGKIMAAQKTGDRIPEGWALDADGAPTTDPDAAMSGSMLAAGGAKGAVLALMVEILATTLTGGHFGWEASSLFDDRGAPPNLGHVLLAINPPVGVFAERMGVLMAALDDTPGARRPGTSRLANRARSAAEGIAIPQQLHREIVALADAAASAG